MKSFPAEMEIISESNLKYKDNYFDIEHKNKTTGGGIKPHKILENSNDEVENIKFVYNKHKIIFQKIN